MHPAEQLTNDVISAAFPGFTVATELRPNGGVLVTLKEGERELKRAIPADHIQSKIHLEWVVSALRRDLAVEAGVAPVIGDLQSQSRVRLPTYGYNSK